MTATAETAHGRAFERARSALRNLALGGLALTWLVSTAVNHIGHGGGGAFELSAEATGLRPELVCPFYAFLAVAALDLVEVLMVALLWPRYAKHDPGKFASGMLALGALAVAYGYVVTLLYAHAHLLLRAR